MRSPVNRNRESTCIACVTGSSGANVRRLSAIVRCGSSRSSRCDRYATRPAARVTMPAAGSRSPLISRSSVDFPAPLRPVSAIRSGPRTVRSTSSNTGTSPWLARSALPTNTVRPAGTFVPGRDKKIRASSRTARSASSSRGLGRVEPPAVYVGRLTRRLLGPALVVARVQPGQAERRAVTRRVARPPLRSLPSLLCLPLLPAQVLLGVAQVLLRHLARLLLGGLVLREVAAVKAQLACRQLGDPVHPVQHRAVVADQ